MLVDPVGFEHFDLFESCRSEIPAELVGRQRTGDAPGPLLHVTSGRLIHVGISDHIGDREPATGAQHPGGLAEDPGLVRGEIDHAVRDDDVDRAVGQRNLLDGALEEFDVLDTRLPLVRPSEFEHLIGHVQANGPPRRTNSLR
jgi:hypothetical protein